MNTFASISSVFLLLVFIVSCKGQKETDAPKESIVAPADTIKQAPQAYNDPFKDLNIDAQIMQVLRRVFQDSQGNLWFVGDDVYYFDGDSLINFSNLEVFRRSVVRQIKEDQNGSIWFGTHTGIVKYTPFGSAQGKPSAAPNSFTKFSEKDGLISNDVWSLEIDKDGIVWVGTYEGISQFNPSASLRAGGKTFTPFILPESEPDPTRGVSGPRIVYSIMQDSKGNMWFATNGGAYIYDPATSSLTNLSEKDGLCNNAVNHILEDKAGNIWFATHHDGVCMLDLSTLPSTPLRVRLRAGEQTFTHISAEEGIEGTEAWSLYEDHSGNIWFPIEHEGIYRYTPSTKALRNFHKEDGLPLGAVHTVVEDTKGRYWLGGFGGLYRLDDTSFVNVTRNGQWD